MLTKNDLRPQKSTIIKLNKQHRKDAVNTDNPQLKRMHWEMAFDYLNSLRVYYGPNLSSDRQAER